MVITTARVLSAFRTMIGRGVGKQSNILNALVIIQSLLKLLEERAVVPREATFPDLLDVRKTMDADTPEVQREKLKAAMRAKVEQSFFDNKKISAIPRSVTTAGPGTTID